MSRRCKVMVIGLPALRQVLAGEARVRNLPADFSIAAAVPVQGGARVGLRVCSANYPPVPEGELLPVMTAALDLPAEVGS